MDRIGRSGVSMSRTAICVISSGWARRLFFKWSEGKIHHPLAGLVIPGHPAASVSVAAACSSTIGLPGTAAFQRAPSQNTANRKSTRSPAGAP